MKNCEHKNTEWIQREDDINVKEDVICLDYGELLPHFPHCKFCTSDAEHQLRGMDLCEHCYEDCLKDEDKENK